MNRTLSAFALSLAVAACTSAAPQAPIPGDLALDEGAFCFEGLEHPLGDFSKSDLVSAVTAAKLVDASIVDSMSSGDASRIIGTLAYLGLAEGTATMADLFELTDDGEMDILEFEIGDNDLGGFWLRFYAADMEYGALFIDGQAKPVAIVEEGTIEGCLAVPIELISCSSDITSAFADFADDSAELANYSSGSRTVTAVDISTLSAREIELLFAASRDLELVDSDDEPSLSQVFSFADEGLIDLISLEWVGEEDEKFSAQWVRFASDGDEVGVVYRNGTVMPLATIDDASIAGCN